MAKKIINKILLLGLIAIIVSLVNVSFVFGQACGPSPGLQPCGADISCGYNECFSVYTTCDDLASASCTVNVGQCEANYATCIEFCYGPQAGSCIANCESLRQTCITTAYSTYQAGVASCQSNAKLIQTAMLGGGSLIKATCGELNSCIVDGSAFGNPSKLLECSGQLNIETYNNALEKYPELAEANMDFTDQIARQSVFDKNYKFIDSRNLGKFIEAERVANPAASPAFNNVLNEQSWSNLANTRNIWGGYGELGTINSLGVQYEIFIKNPIVQAIQKIKSILGFGQQAAGYLGKDNQQEANDARTTYNSFAGQPIGVASTFIPCSSGTVSRDPICGGDNNCVSIIPVSSSPSTCSSNNVIADSRFILALSLHVVDTIEKNLYTLKGAENEGVIFQQDGFVNIDKGGSTEVSVAGEGAPITDFNGNQLLLKGGTHTYYGIGTQDVDTYVSNSVVAHINSETLFDATKDKSGDEFGKISLKKLTGAVTFKPSEGRLATSFDHFTLPNYQNAIDLGKISDGYQLLARGFGDMVLLGQDKFFPLLVRNFLKGDSAIVFNKDVKIINTYVARDNTYDYIIKADNESTKVTARNGKIIQDSSGMPLGLTPRQRSLIYAD